MMKFSLRRTFELGLALLFVFFHFTPENLSRVTSVQRAGYLNRARVWHKTNIPEMNIVDGPRTDIAVPPNTEVTCTYVEDGSSGPGYAPKFKCRLQGSNQLVRVKYSSREVVAEVAGSRLFWMLGFYADAYYPVKLRCLQCPENHPFHPADDEPRVDRVLEPALIEKVYAGAIISEYQDQGWSWEELDQSDPAAGGATKAERDALKLLAVFVQHTDSKPSQQRLACPEKDLKKKQGDQMCSAPILMIQDLGSTFGMGGDDVADTSSMDLEAWRRQPVWNVLKEQEFFQKNGYATCFGTLVPAWDNGLRDPEISEEGRVFLAGLLNQMSDEQIRQLFIVSRADLTGQQIEDKGVLRSVTIEDWVRAFQEKRQEINEHHCFKQ